ncbi:DctP family TRAP transporter solute-binding subunit [Brachyspira pilosicoli]|uniref:DctP family TRAP transporter solute-binding subunit n=1 Tax=Brachyspira pilosicoli TaxID=52584 RepID=UPI001CA4F29C|nr:DctP family TRAP transporter solute-binding subunit [Brachyspira pilosicoli]MBW5397655.1 DctP family TRAP transporter solute-binding subunit [Brachyspira pilosicoli]
MFKKITSISILLVSFLFLASCTNKSSDNAIVIKWGETLPESHPSAQMAIRSAKEITEQTEGRVKVEVYTGGQLGASKEMVEALSLGAQDMLTEGVAQYQMLPSLEILEAPYIWDSPESFDKVVNGPIIEEFNQKLIESGNIRILGTTYYGYRHLTTSDKEVRSLADVANLKIRVPEVQMYIAMAEAWGAKPTPMNINELYLALKQNVVNGQENPLPTINSSKFYEVQKYLILTGHIITARIVTINESVWKKISESDQKIILDVIKKNIEIHNNEIRELESSLISTFEKEGVTVITPNVEEFRNAVLNTVPAQLENKWGAGLFDRIREAQK